MMQVSLSCTTGHPAAQPLQIAANCALNNMFHLPLHTLFDHSEVAISDDLANLVFFQDGGGRQVAVTINC